MQWVKTLAAAASVETRDVDWRAALSHPVGAALLVGGMLLAGAMTWAPGFERWSEQAGWMFLTGVFGYVASASVVARWPPEAPEIRRLRTVRGRIARRLSQGWSRLAYDERHQLESLAGGALVRFGEETVPVMRQLIQRRDGLADYLTPHQGDGDVLPDPAVLERLTTMRDRLGAAIERGVRQAVTAEGTLVFIMQETDANVLLDRCRAWVEDLAAVNSRLADALRSSEGDPLLPTVSGGPAPNMVQLVEPGKETRGPEGSEERHGFAERELLDLVEEALRHLNKPATLARSQLATRLPSTIRAIRSRWGDAALAEATPLERGEALREALVKGVERMKLADGGGDTPVSHYDVLREKYNLGRSVKAICVKYAVSESTFYRYRAEAAEALANELYQQEQYLVVG